MSEENIKTWDIRERSFEYALRAIKLFEFLQQEKYGAGYIIGKQYLRSATSIGANIQEAQSGESKADFIHKFSIAQKEARESLYWLRLLVKSAIVSSDRLTNLIQETQELIAVITKIIINTKKNK
ncbi:four helix bundle protein [Komarekiella sp. 'clone 1']|uniref:Four helix bundle protein n=2 Tax=Komarekiella TaxID=2022127 RepID=A0AA40SW62_9NOST|nr:four helix bundle protein [Komarekiella delphini-convector SJRDD-AB1]